MSDFGKRLREQKSSIESEKADEEAKRKEERATKEAEIAAQIILLKTSVFPVLENCRRELKAEGMDLLVKEAFDVASYMVARSPSIDVTCGSPARKSDGYRFESPALYVEVEGENFRVGVKDRHSSSKPSKLISVSSEEVAEQLEGILVDLAGQALKEWKDSPAAH